MSVNSNKRQIGALVVSLAAIVLFVLHQDFWWWEDRTLVMGFLPVGLAYHACYSIAAACLWAIAVKFAWPNKLEHWAGENHDDSGQDPS